MTNIVPYGSFNPNAFNVPGVVVQIKTPAPVINGIATDVFAVVGIADGGPVNSPVYGSLQELVQVFGAPNTTRKYDLMTQVFTAYMQGTQNFIGLRVTDGTDTRSSAQLFNNSTSTAPLASVLLQAINTGLITNTYSAVVESGSLAGSYKLTITQPGYTPEVFDNISGTGAQLWKNLIDAVNNGNNSRGKSQLVTATNLVKNVGYIEVQSGGTGYDDSTTLTFSPSGATATPVIGKRVATFNITAGGTGYSSNPTVTITGGGGSGAKAVAFITGNAVTSIVLTDPGSGYTSAPTVTISAPGGPGTQATATATLTTTGSIIAANITAGGNYPVSAPTITINSTGGSGAVLIPVLGSVNPPSLQSYAFSGGSNGNTGITAASLLGNDLTTNPTGMYALKSTSAFYMALADCDAPATWAEQVRFGLSYGIEPVLVGQSGQTIDQAITAKNTAAIPENISYATKILVGDYCKITDPTTQVPAFVSPQGFYAGVKAPLLPNACSLNKAVSGIISTQTTQQNKFYSRSDIARLAQNSLDAICINPELNPNNFIFLTGQNASSNRTIGFDNYTTMIFYLARTLRTAAIPYIGQLMTPDVVADAKNSMEFFLQSLANEEIIGDITGGKAYSVIMIPLPATYTLEANVSVVLFPVIVNFLVNLTASSLSISVQSITNNQ